ncbi:MAG: ATP-dependent DNA helicase RecG [Oscillospiraceae bacterium]|jgi:ATP-dependent DNA helicase RecG|nr:ATP-dependent DNA helicase RecG [Oscillospiraceae bacterium]
MPLPLDALPGLGPVRAAALVKAGVADARALVERLPVKYQDSTVLTRIADLRPGVEAAFAGEVASIRSYGYGKAARVHVVVEDDSSRVSLVWFGAAWLLKQLYAGQPLLLYGTVSRAPNGARSVAHPAILERRALLPVYAAVDGMPGKALRGAIAAALDRIGDVESGIPPSLVPESIRLDRREALKQAHFPESRESLEHALRYLSFETLLLYAAALRRRSQPVHIEPLVIPTDITETFWAAQPFKPTGAQTRVSAEIIADMRGDSPMSRLVEGDVGCGKTALAFMAMYAAARSGGQAAMMVPTEILAAQHFRSAAGMLEPLGARVGLLTGSASAKERRGIVAAAADGTLQVVIGTHALFSKDVKFANLVLCVTDEQHRFGVKQRAALSEKTIHPHTLVMSATPIPRTLAMLLYGDMKRSVVDESPPGRLPVETRLVPESKRARMYGFIRAQAAEGWQSYIVCPHATQTGDADCASAEWLAQSLRDAGGPLCGLRVGIAHGGQPSRFRAETLEAFQGGKLDVLVATTVVEVGVDAPGATVMVIENPERFGLAQLHQLRGRVGRGKAKSWCFLMGERNARLDALAATRDGFEIARKDLAMRGPGDLLGVRQHGLPEAFAVASGADEPLMVLAREAADTAAARGGGDAALLDEAARVRFGTMAMA